MRGLPEDVIEVLTDPEACGRWSPIAFDVDGLEGRRLVAGARARVVGRLAGRSLGFDVEVHEADARRLELRASGPVVLDVLYELAPVAGGSDVRASVGVRPRGGVASRLVARATDALLAGGALDAAVARIAREVEAVAA